MTMKELLALQKEGKIAGFRQTEAASQPRQPDQKRSKYGNKPMVIDGMTFDSRKEGRRYEKLALRQKAGEIGNLEFQVSYDLVVNGELVSRYVADFRYIIVATGETVVEDVKSRATRINRVYRIKKKLMKAIYNIEIKEI